MKKQITNIFLCIFLLLFTLMLKKGPCNTLNLYYEIGNERKQSLSQLCNSEQVSQEKKTNQAGKKDRKELNMTTPIKVPSQIWGDELPSTPQLSGDSDELKFEVVPGENIQGATVVLSCSYVVFNPTLDYYGGQLPSPIHVVAFNKETGEVYCAPLLEPKSPPVRVLIPEDTTPSQSGSSQGAAFNIDLTVQLGLPSQEASYKVFLWLDQLLSPVATVDVPENDKRTQSLLSTRKSSALIEFASSKQSGKPGDSAIKLTVTEVSDERIIHGSWDVGPSYSKEKPYYIALIGLCHRERSFGWVSIDINSLPEDVEINNFKFKVSELSNASQESEKVFIVAFSEDHMPQVFEINGLKK